MVDGEENSLIIHHQLLYLQNFNTWTVAFARKWSKEYDNANTPKQDDSGSERDKPAVSLRPVIATCTNWSCKLFALGTSAGYGVYKVNDSDVKWYHKATGKPRPLNSGALCRAGITQKAQVCRSHIFRSLVLGSFQWRVTTKVNGLIIENHKGKGKWPRLFTFNFFTAQLKCIAK